MQIRRIFYFSICCPGSRRENQDAFPCQSWLPWFGWKIHWANTCLGCLQKEKKIHGLFLDLPWHSPSLVGVISIVKYCYNLLAERERVQILGKYKSELLRFTQIYTHPVMDVIVCKRRERRSSFWHHCALLETYGPDIWDFLYVLSDQQNLMLGRPFFHGCLLVDDRLTWNIWLAQ